MDEGPPTEVSAKDLAGIQAVLDRRIGPGGIGLLTTVGADGTPHATWMGTIAAPRWDQITTITSPDSRKAANIRANPRVEWLFSSENRMELVYLEGRAEIVTRERDVKDCWQSLPDKNRAFFLLYFNSELGFCVIRTRVEAVTYCLPAENRKVTLSPELLRGGHLGGERAHPGAGGPGPG